MLGHTCWGPGLEPVPFAQNKTPEQTHKTADIFHCTGSCSAAPPIISSVSLSFQSLSPSFCPCTCPDGHAPSPHRSGFFWAHGNKIYLSSCGTDGIKQTRPPKALGSRLPQQARGPEPDPQDPVEKQGVVACLTPRPSRGRQPQSS